MIEKTLNKFYFDLKQPGSYSGVEAFKRNLKKNGYMFPRRIIKEWLSNQNEYTLHKPARKKFPRNKTIVYGIDDTWQADLVDMQKYSKENRGFKFLLCVIDIFSKYAWVIPLKNKTNTSVISAFKKIFSERKPKRIQTDQGQEFVGRETQKYLKSEGVQFYIIFSEQKAAIVERFNRTLKEKMWRFFTKSGDYKYINNLNNIVNSYNNSYHRSIKKEPINVSDKNKDEIFFNLYGYNTSDDEKKDLDYDKIKLNNKLTLKIGDLVRLSKYKAIFDKGYTRNWTREIFIIIDVLLFHNIPVFVVKDQNGEIIKGTFYQYELQKVLNQETSIFKIEKILESRKINNTTQFLVKWTNLSNQFNSWIESEDIK